MVQLPPEIYSAIASYLATRDLLTLSRTTKALQRAAEPRIYECVVLRDAEAALVGCHSLMLRDGLRALLVNRFILYQDPRRTNARTSLGTAPAQFWLTVQVALTMTVNLESLIIHDPLVAHSWVLDHEDIRFQLREANLRLPWDAHMVAFLEKQHKLQVLNTCDSNEDGPPCPLPPAALGALVTYSGPVLVVAELLGCPLARLQVVLDDDTAPILPTVVADLTKIMKGLRSLSVMGMPVQLLMETLQLVSTAVFAPKLRYLGVLPLPSCEWDVIHRCLMDLPALEVIEFDISRWEAQVPEWMLRAVLLDFRIYAPALQQVIFWIGQTRINWYMTHEGEWQHVRQMGRAPGSDVLWRTL
ncbi:hypothetical protein BD311DRAFT_458795 [Dichomitus squalens]|uniref:F-box domain-containing protein n=1 Tax=Dichomitus squalens TaxID=114155 RepID=A0A4Q9MJJ8_9APHY|nr:hypothetical protein BD311DRAFT_458795 [Dichomitus squalens]